MRYDASLFVDRDAERGFLPRLLKHERGKSVMRFRAEEGMGKSWLLARMGDDCGRGEYAAVAAAVDFRNRREQNEVQDTLSMVWLLRNRLKCPEVFAGLDDLVNQLTAAEPSAPPGPDPGVIIALRILTERIKDAYSEIEIRQTSESLGVPWQDLPHDTRDELASELTRFMYGQGRLRELLAKLKEGRPLRRDIPWYDGLEMLIGREGDEGPSAARGGDGVEERLAPLADTAPKARIWADKRINQVFFDGLAKLTEQRAVALFFDGYESAPDEAMVWIRDELLYRLDTGELTNLVVVLAGRPDPRFSDPETLIADWEIGPFDEESVIKFLEANQVEVSPHVRDQVREAGGKPAELARRVKDLLQATLDSKDPFFD